jgi:hypothetical protein
MLVQGAPTRSEDPTHSKHLRAMGTPSPLRPPLRGFEEGGWQPIVRAGRTKDEIEGEFEVQWWYNLLFFFAFPLSTLS